MLEWFFILQVIQRNCTENIIAMLNGRGMFSWIYLSDACFQIELSEESKKMVKKCRVVSKQSFAFLYKDSSWNILADNE